ncbi:MAG: hypothetical protein HUU06_10525 [Planctomycetaceae bacterium]|nr:hypothetical protein [Planctomycetaceae bacterium]
MAAKKPAISFRDLMAQAGLTPPSGPEVRPPEGSGPDEDLRVLEEAGENPGPRESDTQIIYPEQIIAALAEGSRGAAEALAAAGGERATLLRVEGADHNDLLDVGGAEVLARIRGWVTGTEPGSLSSPVSPLPRGRKR